MQSDPDRVQTPGVETSERTDREEREGRKRVSWRRKRERSSDGRVSVEGEDNRQEPEE